jgi:hypothetical protein
MASARTDCGSKTMPSFRSMAAMSRKIDQAVGIVGAKPRQVGVACGAVGLVVPERKQQCALEQEAICVWGDGNAAQQAPQREAVQQQAVAVAALLRQVQEAGEHGRAVVRGHATAASRYGCMTLATRLNFAKCMTWSMFSLR